MSTNKKTKKYTKCFEMEERLTKQKKRTGEKMAHKGQKTQRVQQRS